MLNHYLGLLGVVLGVCTLAMGDTRPQLPENGEDFRLTDGKSAAEFFAMRQSQTQCRKALATSRVKSLTTRKELKALVAKQASAEEIDQKEDEAKSTRETFLEFMRRCGECGTNAIEYRKVRPENLTGDTEYWSIADGSCFIPQTAWVDSNGFERASEYLLNIGTYPGRKGGFSAIIEMVGENDASGKPAQRVEKSPFHAFIMVRGPVIPILEVITGFSYPFVNQIETQENGSSKVFTIKFASEKTSPNVQIPSSFVDRSASGKATKIKEKRLKTAIGMWYLNSDGYIRYYTAGDFGLGAALADDFAQWVLTDTLATLSEVMAGTEQP